MELSSIGIFFCSNEGMEGLIFEATFTLELERGPGPPNF